MNTSDALPGWADYLGTLGEADAVLATLADPNDPLQRQEAFKLLFMSVAAGFQSTFTDADHPDFVPAVSNILNSVGTNPDFIYASAKIDGTGQYRLSGERGEGLFLMFDFAAGGLSVTEEFGPSTGTLDIDKFTLRDGKFDILLSAQRPAGYDGDWYELDPTTLGCVMRQASYDWGAEREARIAIERLDTPVRTTPMAPEEMARRMQLLAAFPRRYAGFALDYCKGQRDRGLVNALEHDDWAGRGGLDGQHYYQGIFRLEPGTALVMETELPERVRYWNVQLNDSYWNTIDWFNHQSSLNGGQALLDPDGKFRAVIALEDPGIPNWLDPAGHSEGSLMLRWTEASSGPAPTLKLVPLAELDQHLHAQTPRVSPQAREEQLRERRRGAQLRRRW
jgi:hypothetical protein